eukprot:scaffold51582_cov30-Phaeocystis_antarctica.AAC.1
MVTTMGGGAGAGVRAARAQRVVTVEVQAWCAASVVWRVMLERRSEEEKKRRREKGKRVDSRVPP